jgi:FixJ family two-component response regulator
MEPRKMVGSDEIFVLDDDPLLGDLLTHVLESDGYNVSYFRDEEAFTSVARLRTPACILLDVYMPRRSGFDILRDLDAGNYAAPIIIISARASISLAVEATKSTMATLRGIRATVVAIVGMPVAGISNSTAVSGAPE